MTRKNDRSRCHAARHRRIAPVAAILASSASMAAWAADEPDPYTLSVHETISRDSNVFRAPSGPAVFSDWLSTTGLVGTLDEPFGRERLKANAEVDLNRFRNNSQLNDTEHAVSVEGDWATIGHLSGEAGYNDSSQLYRYGLDSTQTLTARNMLATHAGFARFHLGTVTRWTIDANFNAMSQDFSAAAFQYQDMRRWDSSLGATYQSSADLRTSLSYRYAQGTYPHYLTGIVGQQPVTSADDFTRHEVVLGVLYNVSGISTVQLDVSRADEHHSVISQRSFSTWTADGKWIWTPTGRTQLVVDFIRDDDTGASDVSAFGLALASTDAQRRTAIAAKLTYELTSKISVNARGSFAKRDLDTAFSQQAQDDARGSDRLYQASIGLDYAATRAVRLGCNAAREQRTVQGQAMDVVTYPYQDTVWSCTGQFTFR